MASKQHQDIVRQLVARGASTRRFKRAVVKAIKGAHGKEAALLFVEDLAALTATRVSPDAYQIDANNQIVTVFEVELFNTLDEAKVQLYTHWWWSLDELFWELRLVGIRCLFNVGIHYEIPLRDVVYATLSTTPLPTLIPGVPARALLEH